MITPWEAFFSANGSSHWGVIDIFGNRFSDQVNTAIYAVDYARSLNIISNHFTNQYGDVINLLDNYDAKISDNWIIGYGDGGGNFALRLYGDNGRATVRGNTINAYNADSGSTMVFINIPGIDFSGNTIDGYNEGGSVYVNGCVQVYEKGQRGTYTGNRFVQATNFLLSFSHGTTDTAEGCVVTGNSFGWVDVTGWQLLFMGFKNCTVSGNVFGREGELYVDGSAVGILNGATTTTRINVNGNTFKRISGDQQGTSYYNGVIVSDHLNNTECSFSNNTFEYCGLYTSNNIVSRAIYSGGAWATINGNMFFNTFGPLHASGSCIVIDLYRTGCTCNGNVIHQDVSIPGQTYGTFIGIYLNDPRQTVVGNTLYIEGTTSAPRSYSIYGIKNNGYNDHVVMGNNIPIKWTNTSGTNYAIYMGGDSHTVIGNRSGPWGTSYGGGWGIDCSSGLHSLVIGNFSVSSVGSNLTSGNIMNGP